MTQDSRPASSSTPGYAPDIWGISDQSGTSASPSAGAGDAAAQQWQRDVLERLVFATLREQRTMRRWNTFWRLTWVALLAIGLWLFSREATVVPAAQRHTAVVAIQGAIMPGEDASAEHVIASMRSAMNAPGSQALVLLINSPGGSPVQAGMIYDEIRRLREKHPDKPVYAVVEETCASAAYYIAAAADSIYVNRASMVGSIGVLMDGFGFSGLMELLGIERRLMTAGSNKGILDPFSPMNAAQREHVQQMLDEVHRQFIAAVRQGRGSRLKETPDTFSGLIWTGEQAVAQGLADALGTLDSVAHEQVKAGDIVDYTRRGDVMERLSRQLGASIGSAAIQALRGMSVPLH